MIVVCAGPEALGLRRALEGAGERVFEIGRVSEGECRVEWVG
jgi:hypothetical protein